MGGAYKDDLREDIVFFADYLPIYEPETLKHIELKEQFKNKIEKFANNEKLEKNTIGVHIRFTDKKPTTNLEKLIQYLKKNIHDKKIFLATDNNSIIEVFRNNFNGTIIYPKYIPEIAENRGIHHFGLDTNDKKEVGKIILEDSIIEMYLLSKCEQLLYQGNSSFSRISKQFKSDDKCYDWLLI